IGCTGINFPCRGSEHPVIEMIKVDEYDKEEEERRLFYVAMSRAKKSLYLTYAGKRATNYITENMKKIINEETSFKVSKSNDLMMRLKDWRASISKELGVPAYLVLHDKTLIDLAIKRPLTVQELDTVHGLGPNKIMKYGEELLKLITC
ncbi:MAG: HRDC domain-containing protein, partial [Candidatus Bathyarchaeota archaeon]|nr:HRDC domain-containing protein [Candidatus Bathyarchaeota archaeon]